MIPEKQIPTTAFVVEKPGAPFTLQEVILDEVRSNEVLVEMKYTGLCHTVSNATAINTPHATPKTTNPKINK
jgi:Zn-dependent alcohol dehydrogenase